MARSKLAAGNTLAESTDRVSSCSKPMSGRCAGLRLRPETFLMKIATPSGCELRRPGDPPVADPWLCVPALRPVCLYRLRGAQIRDVKRLHSIHKSEMPSWQMQIRRSAIPSILNRLPTGETNAFTGAIEKVDTWLTLVSRGPAPRSSSCWDPRDKSRASGCGSD